MVDSSTVQDSPKKATKPPPCRGPYHCHVASGNASSICAAKCFKCSSSSSANPGQTPEGFLSRTKMANSHQQMTPPRKVFFKMCFIEKRSQILKPGIFFGGVPWKPKEYPKIQSSKPDQRTSHPVTPPPKSWASGAAMTTVSRGSLVEVSGGSWQRGKEVPHVCLKV